MAWMELHQTMPRHPKTVKLAGLMKIKRREACGLLVELWAWGIDTADIDGRLSGMTAADIADAMDYSRNQGDKLVGALVQSGYLDIAEDGTFVLHNWYRYSGKLNAKREADRARKSVGNPRKSPDKANGIPTEIQRKSNGVPCATVPNRTIPYQNQEKEPHGSCAELEFSSPAPDEDTPDDEPQGDEPQTGLVVATLPCIGGKAHGVTQSDLDHYAELYPAVDVPQELRNMTGWLDADPKRRKTPGRGVKRFITGWLTRAQNSGGKRPYTGPPGHVQQPGLAPSGRPETAYKTY